ncbi:hypothetical protein D512_25668 [Burkholderia pseudomallei MSHR1043]|nr:hypothetical protein BURPS1655_D1735 [Burkholderia pseudomallei 1655]EMP73357.1 hypothetical protein D512_25668 [Burkholderia pseudomallei MSHR1043]
MRETVCGEAHARACARRAGAKRSFSDVTGARRAREWARFSRLRAARKRRAQAAERRLQNAE